MNLDRFRGPALALFRMVVGLFFLCHGLASLFDILGGNQGTGQAVEFASWPGWWAALIQLLCGALVLVGLLTRASATLASGSMAYAYFAVHQPKGLLPLVNGGELAAIYSWAFLLIAVLGPGTWALDHLTRRAPSSRCRARPACLTDPSGTGTAPPATTVATTPEPWRPRPALRRFSTGPNGCAPPPREVIYTESRDYITKRVNWFR